MRPCASYAYVTVNGEDWGLFLAVEGVEEAYARRNFGSDFGQIYKPESAAMGGGDKDRDNDPPQMPDMQQEAPSGEQGGMPDMQQEAPSGEQGGMPDMQQEAPNGEQGGMPDMQQGVPNGEQGEMPDMQRELRMVNRAECLICSRKLRMVNRAECLICSRATEAEAPETWAAALWLCSIRMMI